LHPLNLAGGATHLLGSRVARMGQRLEGEVARRIAGLFVRTAGRHHPGVTGWGGPVGNAVGRGGLRLRRFVRFDDTGGNRDQSDDGDRDRAPLYRGDVAPRHRRHIQFAGMYRLASARSPSVSKGRSWAAATGADEVILASNAAIDASAD